MSRNIKTLVLFAALLIVLGNAIPAMGQAKQECRYAVELYEGQLKAGQPTPPVYPDMWMINYPQNVYSAADAEQLFQRDFEFESLNKLGSYRIIKYVKDTMMFFNSSVATDNNEGWHYKVRSHARLNRQIDRADHFLFRNDKDMFPFTVEMIINSPIVYSFRPDSSSQKAMFMFFSYSLHKNFPKHVMGQFDNDDHISELGYDPFDMKFPSANRKAKMVFEAEANYPPNLKALKRSDTVDLMLLVDRDGTVVEVEVVKKSRYSQFDNSARSAGYQMLFEPALDVSGNPVPSWVQYTVVFDYAKSSSK